MKQTIFLFYSYVAFVHISLHYKRVSLEQFLNRIFNIVDCHTQPIDKTEFSCKHKFFSLRLRNLFILEWKDKE